MLVRRRLASVPIFATSRNVMLACAPPCCSVGFVSAVRGRRGRGRRPAGEPGPHGGVLLPAGGRGGGRRADGRRGLHAESDGTRYCAVLFSGAPSLFSAPPVFVVTAITALFSTNRRHCSSPFLSFNVGEDHPAPRPGGSSARSPGGEGRDTDGRAARGEDRVGGALPLVREQSRGPGGRRIVVRIVVGAGSVGGQSAGNCVFQFADHAIVFCD